MITELFFKVIDEITITCNKKNEWLMIAWQPVIYNSRLRLLITPSLKYELNVWNDEEMAGWLVSWSVGWLVVSFFLFVW
jgi:hypothetical protein